MWIFTTVPLKLIGCVNVTCGFLFQKQCRKIKMIYTKATIIFNVASLYWCVLPYTYILYRNWECYRKSFLRKEIILIGQKPSFPSLQQYWLFWGVFLHQMKCLFFGFISLFVCFYCSYIHIDEKSFHCN